MLKINFLKTYKSINKLSVELPAFTVLTGKNGSGKTHFLEAIAETGVVETAIDGKITKQIQYVEFNGLIPKISSDCSFRTLLNEKKKFFDELQKIVAFYKSISSSSSEDFESHVSRRTYRDAKLICKIYNDAGGDLSKLEDESFVGDHYVISADESKKLFFSKFALIFKSYAEKLYKNNYRRFLKEKGNQDVIVLSDEEFDRRFGPKPWDLVNSILKVAGLSYQVNYPKDDEFDTDFHLRLFDTDRNLEINVNDLSTGEKVLMSLALAIYNVSEDASKPDVLLLDEPDASLHPEFSKILIDVINKTIVEEAGVNVIITTHSPTTVAMSEESWIYTMRLGEGPYKITREGALSVLLRDIDNLRVSVENRRQVFVESQNDVKYFEQIYNLTDRKGIASLQFLAPSQKPGSNCEDVKTMVELLREKGNDLVFGIIDYDNHNSSTDYIKVIGEGSRYSIEHYIYDPIYIVLLLIREKAATFFIDEMEVKFSHIRELSVDDIQKLINEVCANLGFVEGDTRSYHVQNGNEFYANESFFKFQGHNLEEKILSTWPKLNAVKRGDLSEAVMKNYVIKHVIGEYPEYLSSDFGDLFESIV